jgi:hypothetical protein
MCLCHLWELLEIDSDQINIVVVQAQTRKESTNKHMTT